jgi:hypothetical protein
MTRALGTGIRARPGHGFPTAPWARNYWWCGLSDQVGEVRPVGYGPRSTDGTG